MKKSITKWYNIMMCLVAAVFLTSCGKPTHESLAEDIVVKMEEIASALESAKDVDSAKAAAEKIKGITAEMKDLKAQMDKIGKPSAEKEKELEEKYKERMTAAMDKIMNAGMAMAKDPEVGKILQESMESMGEVMVDK